MPILLLFILVPLLELMVFIAVSAQIGFFVALMLCILMAFVGAFVVQYQGFSTMAAAQQALQNRRLPSKELFDALLICIAGGLMIIPGFISDILGFALLLPPIRDIIRDYLAQSTRFKMQGFNSEFTEFHNMKSHHHPKDPDVIDVKFETISEHDKLEP